MVQAVAMAILSTMALYYIIDGDNAVIIIRGGKNFVGLIFVVEGTHENLNTMKISAYMVLHFVLPLL